MLDEKMSEFKSATFKSKAESEGSSVVNQRLKILNDDH